MKHIAIALMAFAFIASACSEDPVTPADTNTSDVNSFNVDGSGYTNAAFKGFNGDTASSASELTGDASVEFTGLTNKDDEPFSIIILMNDNKAQVYQVSPQDQVAITLMIRSTSGTMETYFSVSGEIDLKTWDAVGGRAKGTFSGAFTSTTGKTITVTKGKFDVKRIS